ncbi:MAG: hypothetical protein QW692_01865 [Nitrososphaerota archaeon]
MPGAVKVVLKQVYGQGGAEWIIYAPSEEAAEIQCQELVEKFRPKFAPDDEFYDFGPIKGEYSAYKCRYDYRYAKRARRVI